MCDSYLILRVHFDAQSLFLFIYFQKDSFLQKKIKMFFQFQRITV